MLVRPVPHALATWKLWMLIVAAIVLGLVFATAVGAADVRKPVAPPQLLPGGIEGWSRPMPVEPPQTLIEGADLGNEIWRILELHRTEKHAAAIDAWNHLNVPHEVDAWKWLALGAASTSEGQFEEAEKYLQLAIDVQPNKALGYYLRGVLRMQQALVAYDWPIAPPEINTRLVALQPQLMVPKSRDMYELAATMDFELVIQLASTMHLDESIIPTTLPSGTALEPTVGDLALALSAENFDAKAHAALGRLFLKRGALELAEQRLDDAASQGLTVIDGYCDLGDEYRARGQFAAALRVHLKSSIHIMDELLRN